MGISVILDLIGSFFIGGILLLMIVQANSTATENTFTYTNDMILQRNVTSFAQIVEFDFSRIGYCEDVATMVVRKSDITLPNIVLAERNRISFVADLPVDTVTGRGDGNFETITYSVKAVSSYPNPNIKHFIRNVSGQPVDLGGNYGITDFYLRYFKTLGEELIPPFANLSDIRLVEMNVKFEDPYGYDTKTKLAEAEAGIRDSNSVFVSAFWQQIKLSVLNE